MKSAGFELHPRLQQDCIPLGRFSLCRLLLMNDSHYPWFILVPERAAVSEIFELDTEDQHRLSGESSLLARTLSETFRADKINIAAIGNLVPQLHLHHVVRYRNDVAWPAPVWGKVEAQPYSESALGEITGRIVDALNKTTFLPTAKQA